MTEQKLYIAWHIILACFNTKYCIHYIFCGIYGPRFVIPRSIWWIANKYRIYFQCYWCRHRKYQVWKKTSL